MAVDRRRFIRGTSGAAIFSAIALVYPHASLRAEGRTAHDFTFTALEGGHLSLAEFAGRALLIVNTASFCGYTPQYEGLQALFERYEDSGFTVIGIPSNDFGGQEPGSEAEIREFCEGIYGVRFPLAGKTPVKGPQAHPFYVWARETLGAESAPRWNFHKYLVTPEGRLAGFFPTRTKPDDPNLLSAIEGILPER